jgi:hypothetical protein
VNSNHLAEDHVRSLSLVLHFIHTSVSVEWIETRTRHRAQQVENIVHNERSIVTQRLRNSERHLNS